MPYLPPASDPNVIYNPRRTSNQIIWRPPLEQENYRDPRQSNTYGLWEEDWKDLGALEKVFSVLSIGQYVSANVVNAILRGDGDIAGAIWRGLTMQERGDFIDILKRYNVPWAPVLGTILDIGLDPTTWLSGPVSIFKKVAKTAGYGEALAKATNFINDLNPVKKLAKAFDIRAGMNDKLFDELLFGQYAKNSAQVDVIKKWNEFAKGLTKEDLKLMSYYRTGIPTQVKNMDRYTTIVSEFDKLTKEMLDLKILTPEIVAKHEINGISTYLPRILHGQLLNWRPGLALNTPEKLPGFAFKRTLKIKDEDFFPMAQRIADSLENISKGKDVEEMRKIAMSNVAALQERNPFRQELTRFLEDSIAQYKGDVRKIRKALLEHSAYFTPVDSITDLGKIYESNLVHWRAQKKFKDVVLGKVKLEGAELEEFAPVLKPDDVIGGRTIIIDQESASSLIRQLNYISQQYIPKKEKVAQVDLRTLPEYAKVTDIVKKISPSPKKQLAITKALDIDKAVPEISSMRVGDILLDESTNTLYRVTQRSGFGVTVRDQNRSVAWITREDLGNYKKLAIEKPPKVERQIPEYRRAENAAKKLVTLIRSNPKIFADLIPVKEKDARGLAKLLDSIGIQSDAIRVIDKDVMNVITRAGAFYKPEDKTTNEFLKLYDKVLGHWTRWTTIMRLPFHVRNFISNSALAFMAGVEPWEMQKYAQMAALVQKGSDQVITVGKIAKTGKEWLETANKRGIRGMGFLSSIVSSNDVEQALLFYTVGKPKGPVMKLLNAGYDVAGSVGGTIEDNARIMTFLNRLAKNGGNEVDAAKHVWKYLFQYDQLTDFEKTTMKRIIPFYTWMRKNIPLQVHELLYNPGRLKAIAKVEHGMSMINPETSEEHKFRPEYTKELFYFKLPEMPKKWFEKLSGKELPGNVYVNIDLPINDLASLTSLANFSSRILSSLSPALIPVKIGHNIKGFPELDTPIERFKGELQPAPWPALMLPEGLWPAFGLQPMKDPKSGRTIVGMPAKAVEALVSLVPPISNLTKLFPQTRGYIEDAEAPWKKLSWFTGVKLQPINLQEEKYYWQIGRKNRLREAARYIKQLGRPMTQKELEQFLDEYQY